MNVDNFDDFAGRLIYLLLAIIILIFILVLFLSGNLSGLISLGSDHCLKSLVCILSLKWVDKLTL